MTSTPGLRRPPGRYDERRRLPPWARYGGGALLLVALIAFSVVAYRQYASSRASFTNDGSQVQSDTAVLVRFAVVVEARQEVQCLLQARDRDNVEVGSAVVTVQSDKSGTVHRLETVPTTRRAIAAEVLSCRPKD